jgi:signal transduction histidine kinase
MPAALVATTPGVVKRKLSVPMNRTTASALPTADFDAITDAFNTMAQRLRAVEDTRRQLLADLAHEIRTPVSVLEAYMEALEDGVQPLDQDTIGMLRDQTRRLVRFSVDVNALAVAERRTTSVDARWVSADSLVATALAAFTQRYTAKGVTLESDVGQDLPQLWADPERIGQVLGNLLDNALLHTQPNGRVRVIATSADDSLTIAVSDTGDVSPPSTCPACSNASIVWTPRVTASTAERSTFSIALPCRPARRGNSATRNPNQTSAEAIPGRTR